MTHLLITKEGRLWRNRKRRKKAPFIQRYNLITNERTDGTPPLFGRVIIARTRHENAENHIKSVSLFTLYFCKIAKMSFVVFCRVYQLFRSFRKTPLCSKLFADLKIILSNSENTFIFNCTYVTNFSQYLKRN